MESLLKGLFESLLIGGTVGVYAMASLILIIIGYFKYLRPFLQDFYDMKGVVSSFNQKSDSQSITLEKIHHILLELNSIIDKKGDSIVVSCNSENSIVHKELKNLMDLIEKELLVVLDRTEKISSKNENNHREIMVEIAKLQTRLEFLNTSAVRGIQK